MEAIGKLLEHLSYIAPPLYAAAAYGLFHWLDENLSDAAKAALASTMKLKDYRKEQVAPALVEVFDRVYTYPLLRWRAFVRSLLFTTVVSVIFAFEIHRSPPNEPDWPYHFWGMGYIFNVFTDYLSLFVIRSLLIRSGMKPVIGLVLGTLSGAAIVYVANVPRAIAFMILYLDEAGHLSLYNLVWFFGYHLRQYYFFDPSIYWDFIWPATAVFVWLPLFALGIIVVRALTPLSWIVAKAQWALKEGDKHPLRAIGCVAAVVVFVVTVGLRTMIAV